MDLEELTVGQLKRILLTADDAATIPEALEQLAADRSREAADAEHIERQRAYDAYVQRRLGREREYVQRAADDAKQTALTAAPVSHERLAVVFQEAAERARLHYEVHAPYLQFAEWCAAGEPTIHEIKGAVLATGGSH
jgi:hypothetical protein